jgi:hypothetical protein
VTTGSIEVQKDQRNVGEGMFEDSTALENQTEGDQNTTESNEKSSWWIGRWAHVIAGLSFCLLYFPFQNHSWIWLVAIMLTYIVFMFCCTCGMAFQDSDDFFGNLQVSRFMAKLLMRQVFVLMLISFGAYLWLRLKTILPDWMTYESRRGSLWDFCGLILFYWAAVKEASWMARKIKRQFSEDEN